MLALNYYPPNEDIEKYESINKYENIFFEYSKELPSIKEALHQLFKSSDISDQKAYDLVQDILSKAGKVVEFNYKYIQEKYPMISTEDAIIISSYTCECESAYSDYSPIKIVNRKLNEESREEIKSISKYLFIFLKAIRKLDRFYPKGKYMFRCINKKVNLDEDYLNNNIISYRKGNTKTFWGFTSITSSVNMTYKYKGIIKEIEKGTIFDLYGNFWGYDISLFDMLVNEHIILEQEWESLVMNAINPSNSNK
jgi:hypothetical protein